MSPGGRAARGAIGALPSSQSFPTQLFTLLHHPLRAFPALLARRSSVALIGFPAISGIYVAYVLATGVGLGDRIGPAAAAAVVAFAGPLLGVTALWFAGTLPYWTAQPTAAEEDETARMFFVFSYATWPFLPLLAILVPAETLLYGEALFSRQRPGAPTGAVWGLHALQLASIGAWLFMMVKGTALVRRESDASAARELLRWGAELLAIGVLFALIVLASVMYW